MVTIGRSNKNELVFISNAIYKYKLNYNSIITEQNSFGFNCMYVLRLFVTSTRS